ncbi:hypothetical protein WNZ15_08990 [Roseibium sp. AS2]|uniref:hypothetical protein n=1 Tax=Roseibium sp. AS2 TaxID=3135781 RepID=UPI003176A13B
MARKDPIDHALMASEPLAPSACRLVPVAATGLHEVPGAAVLAAFVTGEAGGADYISASLATAGGADPAPVSPQDHAGPEPDMSEAYQCWLSLLSRYTGGLH